MRHSYNLQIYIIIVIVIIWPVREPRAWCDALFNRRHSWAWKERAKLRNKRCSRYIGPQRRRPARRRWATAVYTSCRPGTSWTWLQKEDITSTRTPTTRYRSSACCCNELAKFCLLLFIVFNELLNTIQCCVDCQRIYYKWCSLLQLLYIYGIVYEAIRPNISAVAIHYVLRYYV